MPLLAWKMVGLSLMSFLGFAGDDWEGKGIARMVRGAWRKVRKGRRDVHTVFAHT